MDHARPSKRADNLGCPSMRFPSRLVVVLLFLSVGMLALVFAGVLDWIVGVLFLLMEFLSETLRNIFLRRRDRRHPPTRNRLRSDPSLHAGRPRRRSVRSGGRPHRRRPVDPAPGESPERRPKVLVAMTKDDPHLLGFALGECVSRQGEMILLFLRLIAVTPMGPNPLPNLSEDDEARDLFDRVVVEADRAGVSLQILYVTTVDRPATIGEVARSHEADVVIVGATRGNFISRLLTRDPNPSILRLLPEQASLMIRAS